MKKHCYESMTEVVTKECIDHFDHFDYSDRLFHYSESLNEYEIIIHDEGSSYSKMEYCPWWGASYQCATNNCLLRDWKPWTTNILCKRAPRINSQGDSSLGSE
jgi:hypothetical protein